jgi:Trypsin
MDSGFSIEYSLKNKCQSYRCIVLKRDRDKNPFFFWLFWSEKLLSGWYLEKWIHFQNPNGLTWWFFHVSTGCGERNDDSRIVGGNPAGVNQYPWMARLSYFNRFYCGAMLINDRYVLTAAHCVKGYVTGAIHDLGFNFFFVSFTASCGSWSRSPSANTIVATTRNDPKPALYCDRSPKSSVFSISTTTLRCCDWTIGCPSPIILSPFACRKTVVSDWMKRIKQNCVNKHLALKTSDRYDQHCWRNINYFMSLNGILWVVAFALCV